MHAWEMTEVLVAAPFSTMVCSTAAGQERKSGDYSGSPTSFVKTASRLQTLAVSFAALHGCVLRSRERRVCQRSDASESWLLGSSFWPRLGNLFCRISNPGDPGRPHCSKIWSTKMDVANFDHLGTHDHSRGDGSHGA